MQTFDAGATNPPALVAWPEAAWTSAPLSLGEIVRRFFGDSLFGLAAELLRLQVLAQQLDPVQPIPAGRHEVLRVFDRFAAHCRDADLRFSLRHLERMRQQAEAGLLTARQLGDGLSELGQRIEDELGARFFVQIPAEKWGYYDSPTPFGETVADAFPSARYDIEEAARCYALGRSTATVMHLSRAAEVGLRSLGRALGCDLDQPSWGAILAAVEQALQRRRADRRAGDVDFYAQAAVYLREVKDAWRNPSAHAGRRYSETEARDILDSTRKLLEHLAARLSG